MLASPFLRWALLMLAASCVHSAFAGRNDGLNVAYECLGNGDYRITVNLFRDCAEFTDTPDFIDVHISSSCDVLGYIELDRQYSQEVSQLCPESLPYSSCNGGTLPGVDLTVYSGVVHLEPCADWKFIVAEQNRAIVNNLDDPGLDSRIHIETLLNNADGNCNTSPRLSLLNLPFICLDEPYYYNLGFEEPDGDSLVYALVPALTSGADGIPMEMNYMPGYSGSAPIDAISLNPATGQLTINPDLNGKYTVVLRVREYRQGLLVGEVFHDFSVFVNPCTVPPPGPVAGSLVHVSGGGYPLGDALIGICPGDDFCFEIAFESPDPSVSLTLSSDISDVVPGAVESQVGSNPAVVRFCGTASANIDYQSFVITAIDDVCDIFGQAYFAIAFRERAPMEAAPDTLVCAGSPVTLHAMNDTAYTWYGYDGGLLAAPGQISCNPCPNPVVQPDTTTSYVVLGEYSDSQCSHTDTVTVEVALDLDTTVVPETCYENDGMIAINVLHGSGNYEFLWDDIGPGPPTRSDLNEGTYSVVVSDLVLGCSKNLDFVVDHLIVPDANAGDDSLSCGLSLPLSATPSFGDRSWTSPDGVVFDDSTAPDATATAPSEGSYTLIWTENDGEGCVDSDTLHVDFFLAPDAEISALDTVCGNSTEIVATVENAAYSWNAPPGIEFQDTSLNPVITTNEYGTQWAAINASNGPCTASDTAFVRFIHQPVANAGPDVFACGDTALLLAEPSVGAGEWLLPTGIEAVPGPPPPQGLAVEAESYGVYELIWTETVDNYCVDSDTVSVRFTEMPEIHLPADTATCGDTLLLDPEATIGELNWHTTPPYDLQPLGGGGVLVYGPPGDTFVSLLADNGYGCTAADTVDVAFLAQPEIDISTGVTSCGWTAWAVAQGQADNLTWTSQDLTIGDVHAAQTQVTAAADGTYTLMLIGTNAGGCADTAQTDMTFYEVPIPYAGPDTAVCGLLFDADGTTSAGDFQWSLPSGLTATDAADPHAAVQAVDFGLYPLVAVSQNGPCMESDTAWVRFDPPPHVDMAMPENICQGESALMELTLNGQGPFIFDIWHGQTMVGTYECLGDTVLEFSEAGQYAVSALHDGYCPSPDSVFADLAVHDLPEAEAGEDMDLCPGDTVWVGMSPQAGTSYAWSADESLLGPNDAQSLFAADNTGSFPVAHTLVLTAHSAYCTHSDTAMVTVYPFPEVQIVAPEQACVGETIGLVGYGADGFHWSPIGLFDDPQSATPSMTANTDTDIALIGINLAGCADTATAHIDALPRPDATFALSPPFGCAPLTVVMEAVHPHPGATYRWNTGSTIIEETSGSTEQTYSEAGTYIVRLEATSPEGCAALVPYTDTVEVHKVNAAFGFVPEHPSIVDAEVYFSNASTGAVNWLWTVDSALVSEGRNLAYTFSEVEGRKYRVCLTATDAEGCRDEYCRTVDVKGDRFFYVPNAFTPNGDGLNDLFYPEMTFFAWRDFRFWVTNRRGETVFETEDLQGKWNGTERQSGYLAPPDVYVWHIVARAEGFTGLKHYTGRVMLVR